MADPKIEALAKAIEEARETAIMSPATMIPFSDGMTTLEAEIEALTAIRCEAIQMAMAQAALRFLGCVNEKGEVVALEEGAVGKALEALEAIVAAGGDVRHARAALRALRGGGGEE